MKYILLPFFVTLMAQASPIDLVDAIQNLRQVTEDIAGGKQTAATGEKAKLASATLNIGCNGVGSLPHSNFVMPLDITDGESAVVLVQPTIQCDSVQNGFGRAKAYWAELICITKHVLWESARRYPNLRYIKQLVSRAETLRQKIEVVFPVGWDASNQEFVFEWQPASGPLTAFTTESVGWNGKIWKMESYPRPLQIAVQDGKVSIKKILSTTRICLEPLGETLYSKFKTDNQPESSVQIYLSAVKMR